MIETLFISKRHVIQFWAIYRLKWLINFINNEIILNEVAGMGKISLLNMKIVYNDRH